MIDRESSVLVNGKGPVSAGDAPCDKPSVLVPSLPTRPSSVPAGPQLLPGGLSHPAGPASNSAGPLLQPYPLGDSAASPNCLARYHAVLACPAKRVGPLLQPNAMRDFAAGPDSWVRSHAVLAGPSGPPLGFAGTREHHMSLGPLPKPLVPQPQCGQASSGAGSLFGRSPQAPQPSTL